MTQHIIVIGGGQNVEHDVALGTAAAIAGALYSLGFEVTAFTIGRDGIWRCGHHAQGLTAAASVSASIPLLENADAVFPAVHGPLGEDGTLAALCALTHTRLVGSSLQAGAIGMDKWVTKLIAASVGISTAPGYMLSAGDVSNIKFESPVVVKPVAAGSSYGVGLARDAVELKDALRTAAIYDDQILVERVIQGREIDVVVLREADGSRWAPPPLEIHTAGLFDTATKYNGSARFTVPAELGSTDRAALTESALTMFDALGCDGVARMDFFLTESGPVLNEVNTLPGMTAESQVPKMFAAAGVRYKDLAARLVASARVPLPGGPDSRRLAEKRRSQPVCRCGRAGQYRDYSATSGD